MDVVFATYDAIVRLPDGAQERVHKGEHRLATDAVVQSADPGLFSRSPQYGLRWYGPPPAEMAEPPVEQATAAPGERRARVNRG